MKSKILYIYSRIVFVLIVLILLASCNNPNYGNNKNDIIDEIKSTNDQLDNTSSDHTSDSIKYRDTFTKITTYFDLTTGKRMSNPPYFTFHVKCPDTWNGDNGIYLNGDELMMLVSGITYKINKDEVLNKSAYDYTYRNNDNYDFLDSECIIGITNKNIPYVLYKNHDSYSGYVVFKFYDEYVSNIEFDSPTEEIMYAIINSVYLEKHEEKQE